ncbi:MAG: PII-interacting protein PipX family protein, partial [Snowella sp.]
QRLFFLVNTAGSNLSFQPIARSEARLMVENRLRNLRRSHSAVEYKSLQQIYQQTFQ